MLRLVAVNLAVMLAVVFALLLSGAGGGKLWLLAPMILPPLAAGFDWARRAVTISAPERQAARVTLALAMAPVPPTIALFAALLDIGDPGELFFALATALVTVMHLPAPFLVASVLALALWMAGLWLSVSLGLWAGLRLGGARQG